MIIRHTSFGSKKGFSKLLYVFKILDTESENGTFYFYKQGTLLIWEK